RAHQGETAGRRRVEAVAGGARLVGARGRGAGPTPAVGVEGLAVLVGGGRIDRLRIGAEETHLPRRKLRPARRSERLIGVGIIEWPSGAARRPAADLRER